MTESMVPSLARVLRDIADERARQSTLYPDVDLPDGTGERGADARAVMARELCDLATRMGEVTWRDVLLEEVFEAVAEQDHERLREELVQVAAVAVKWVQAIDRRGGAGSW